MCSILVLMVFVCVVSLLSKNQALCVLLVINYSHALSEKSGEDDSCLVVVVVSVLLGLSFMLCRQ